NVDPREGDRLRGELKRCAVPVYVVFFALAGSGLDLDALATMWPWALLLVGLRIHGLRWGARWAGGELAQYGWLALISQGGLAITLAAYVSIDASSDSGCTVFSANGTPSTVEYLVVPQFATGVPGKSGSFRLGGDTILPAPAPSPGVGESAPSPVLQFHDFLRHGEE